MKTSLSIPDSLFEEAKKIVHTEKTTIKALVEEGLRLLLEERKQIKPFKLRKATFKGKGLYPHLPDTTWEHIREMGYEGRGVDDSRRH